MSGFCLINLSKYFLAISEITFADFYLSIYLINRIDKLKNYTGLISIISCINTGV